MPVSKRAEEHQAGNRRPYPQCPENLRPVAVDAWVFRWQVELEAEVRFAHLSQRLANLGGPKLLAELAQRASDDERRHAKLCLEAAQEYGYPGRAATSPATVSEIAPRRLSERQKVLYELVASCCITETESMSVLTTLLQAAKGQWMKSVLQEIARDEVSHSRLGWAFLASEHAAGSVKFLASLIPDMLEGTVTEGLFARVKPHLEDPELLQHGVLPHSTKRSIFVQTLRDVVFPGLEYHAVDTEPARAWLSQKMENLAQPA